MKNSPLICLTTNSNVVTFHLSKLAYGTLVIIYLTNMRRKARVHFLKICIKLECGALVMLGVKTQGMS